MNGFKEMERMLQNTESKLQQMVWDETNKLRKHLLTDSAVRWVLIKAMLSELDEEQRARVEAKAEELAGSPEVKNEVRVMFHPEEADDD
ncbi:MAG: hypothetical protein KJ755_16620 [Alphaproteobacteria bacterium]|nr:hypothetical protein [Alphaproteobacteria bacterium]